MSAAVDTVEAEGALENASAAQLLAEGWRNRRSGGLCLSRNQTQRIIQLTDGAPTGIEIKGDLTVEVLAGNARWYVTDEDGRTWQVLVEAGNRRAKDGERGNEGL